MFMISCSRLANGWINEATWVIGLEFLPKIVRASVRAEAVNLLSTGTLTEAKREVFRTLYRYSKGRKYAEARNLRNWKWRVAPTHS